MLRIGFNRNTDKSLDFSGESSMLNSGKKIFMSLRQLFRACIQTEVWFCTDAGSSNEGPLCTEINGAGSFSTKPIKQSSLTEGGAK